MSTARIPVHRRGQAPVFATIDAQDLPKVAGRHWMLTPAGVQATFMEKTGSVGRKGRTVLLHRLILDHPKGSVSHLDRDKLNCTKANLVSLTHTERALRQKPRKTYKGVWKDNGRYRASVTVNGQPIHLGNFSTEEEAARRYDAYVREHIGPKALTNEDLGLFKAA